MVWEESIPEVQFGILSFLWEQLCVCMSLCFVCFFRSDFSKWIILEFYLIPKSCLINWNIWEYIHISGIPIWIQWSQIISIYNKFYKYYHSDYLEFYINTLPAAHTWKVYIQNCLEIKIGHICTINSGETKEICLKYFVYFRLIKCRYQNVN